MDGLTFIDHLIGHLAWPLAVSGLIGFMSLRHRGAIDSLIHRVHKAKAGLFEIELAEAKARADRVHLPLPPVPAPSGAPKDRSARPTDSEPLDALDGLLQLAVENPRRAVIESYHRVHQYVEDASGQLDPGQFLDADGSPVASYPAAVRALTPEYLGILHRLRLAAILAQDPDEEVTPSQAREYVLLAYRVVAYMEGSFDAERAIQAGRLLERAKRLAEGPGP